MRHDCENLKEDQRMFIGGIEFVTEQALPNAIEYIFEDYMNPDQPTHCQLIEEVKKSLLKALTDYLDMTEEETIRDMEDENGCE